jgi:hypothetical protein
MLLSCVTVISLLIFIIASPIDVKAGASLLLLSSRASAFSANTIGDIVEGLLQKPLKLKVAECLDGSCRIYRKATSFEVLS